MQTKTLGTALLATLLAACGTMQSPMEAPQVPAAIAVPAGNKLVAVLATNGGMLTYECRAKAGAAGSFEWAFAGPNAALKERSGNTVGKYYGGPTWEHVDGSKVTAKQVAVSPGAAGAIPLQLVKADPATGSGMMVGTSYIQRLNTVGGVAPGSACGAGTVGAKQTVPYSADYYFYKS